jgi:hypothetical protein
MVIVFMALFSIVISEFISLKIGKKLFIPLMALGLFTIKTTCAKLLYF